MHRQYVYIVEDKEAMAFKIGIAHDPKQRLAELQVGNPHQLVLSETTPGTHRDESRMQGQYHVDHIRGEWFRLHQSGDEFLAQGREGNVACLILGQGRKWTTKFNIKANETGMCIVEFDANGYPVGYAPGGQQGKSRENGA